MKLFQPSPYKTHTFYEDGNWQAQKVCCNQFFSNSLILQIFKASYKNTVKKLVEAYVKTDATATLPNNYDDMIDNALELERVS